ncbi:MAG: hypothetical protein GAK43_01960 [Stenotrophomonas maltophilia]|nr:MAG: hypothetical protein GAK43_01960 [Stenotrophomonas maltophilia]
MPWKCLLEARKPLAEAAALEDWYAALVAAGEGCSSFERAVLGGRLSVTPGRAFLAGYQAALHALWPAAPEGLGALCVTERGKLRPAEFTTRLDGLMLHGTKDFATAGAAAAWWLVAARDETPGEAPRLAMTVVRMGAPGVQLQERPPLAMLPDIPHARLLLDGAHCERLPGDGWSDWSKPFRTLEDTHVLAALVAWLYGIGLSERWDESLQLRLVGVLGGCAEVARHAPDQPTTHLLLAGVFAQFQALQGLLDEALVSADEELATAWRRDRTVLELSASARQRRLQNAQVALGFDASQ